VALICAMRTEARTMKLVSRCRAESALSLRRSRPYFLDQAHVQLVDVLLILDAARAALRRQQRKLVRRPACEVVARDRDDRRRWNFAASICCSQESMGTLQC
jgi:hypothetical protein